MDDFAIVVENLGKRYRIGNEKRESRTLVETLSESLRAPFRRARKLISGEATGARDLDDTIWAIKDITFRVRHGEVVGVIGSNGAGKSTLLKLLSQITVPTTGHAEIRGRVGSLLEVGTGFHPELTGTENVYLNGAILGMTRAEIDAKYEEIVEFAELRRFMGTPVKHFSSGMRVRLAFAVAAHLEPEILLIDEVLSVGDVAFRKKCLGKMRDVAGSGRTVLFVSHNMSTVNQLCERVMWIEEGQIQSSGSPAEVISDYLSAGVQTSATWTRPEDAEEKEETRIERVQVLSDAGESTPIVPYGQPFKIKIEFEVFRRLKNFSVACRVTDNGGRIVWTAWDSDSTDWYQRDREPGFYTCLCHVPAKFLRPGRYYLTAGTLIRDVRWIERFEHLMAFDVSYVGYHINRSRQGVVTPILDWEVERSAIDNREAIRGQKF